jgi:hypothetical protein
VHIDASPCLVRFELDAEARPSGSRVRGEIHSAAAPPNSIALTFLKTVRGRLSAAPARAPARSALSCGAKPTFPNAVSTRESSRVVASVGCGGGPGTRREAVTQEHECRTDSRSERFKSPLVGIPLPKYKPPPTAAGDLSNLAGPTGLEPATSGVTGRRSNQLNYDPALGTRSLTCAGQGAFPRTAHRMGALGGCQDQARAKSRRRVKRATSHPRRMTKVAVMARSRFGVRPAAARK